MKLSVYDPNGAKDFNVILITSREGSSVSSIRQKLDTYNITYSEGLIGELAATGPSRRDLFSPDFPDTWIQYHILPKTLSHCDAKKTSLKLSKDNELYNFEKIIVDIELLENEDFGSTSLRAWLTGMLIADYNIGLYRSSSSSVLWNEIHIQSTLSGLDSAFTDTIKLADTIKSVMTLVNAPSNKKTSISLSEWAIASSKAHGYECSIIEKEQLKSMKMDALLAVNRGSEVPARLIICEYVPNNPKGTICLVGKGVTFDTGGISIKGSKNMHYMKSDMGGAAAVLGTVEIIAKYGIDFKVVGIVPATDNSVDALAINPGDVIDSYSGKTIEVINTDAEGRLVLADGLNFAVKKYDPDVLIDLATLTGSAFRTLGYSAAAVMTENSDLLATLQAAADETDEKIWRLPLFTEYGEMMQSEIADIKNLSDAPIAGASTAGKFLEFFTEEHACWAHFDIAGVAFGPGPLSKSHHASGYGITLLSEWLRSDALIKYLDN